MKVLVVDTMSGCAFEKALLGTSYDEVCEMFGFPKRRHNEVEALDNARRLQSKMGWNPSRPSTNFTRRMRDRIAPQLPRGSVEVKICLSVGTTLDRRFGTDFFIEYKGAVVKVDLSVSPKKNSRADVVISSTDVSDESLFCQKIDVIVDLLREKKKLPPKKHHFTRRTHRSLHCSLGFNA